jgi:hypothetical protein
MPPPAKLPLPQRLEAGFDAPIAFGEAQGLAGGFDGGFRVGHDDAEIRSWPKTQLHGRESRVLSGQREFRRTIFFSIPPGIFRGASSLALRAATLHTLIPRHP